jgi:hypothetical protein
MNDAKYIGLDVHQANDHGAVRDSAGELALSPALIWAREPLGSSLS